jgi:hypothetical protein
MHGENNVVKFHPKLFRLKLQKKYDSGTGNKNGTPSRKSDWGQRFLEVSLVGSELGVNAKY